VPAQHPPSAAERPLGAYGLLAASFLAGAGTALTALERSGRRIPHRIDLRDLALLAVGTHKLSRVIAKARVTAFLRAPFTEHRGSAGHGESDDVAVGTGVRRAVGELLVCPYCLAMWVAGGLLTLYVAAPRVARLSASALTAVVVSDMLQIAYKAMEDRARP